MSTLRIPEVVPSPKEDCETLKKAFVGLSLILFLFPQLGPFFLNFWAMQ